MSSPGYINSRLYHGTFVALTGVVLLATIFLSGCNSGEKKRPIGYHNLGKLSGLLAPETYLPENKLLLRRDEKGFYVMSTMCTYDLTYLERKSIDGKDLWVSTYTTSKYDMAGNVVSGPATVNLPYYELKIDASTYGGPRDSLYAYVGKEVNPSWRLELK